MSIEDTPSIGVDTEFQKPLTGYKYISQTEKDKEKYCMISLICKI